jgi:hypothetical protein
LLCSKRPGRGQVRITATMPNPYAFRISHPSSSKWISDGGRSVTLNVGGWT